MVFIFFIMDLPVHKFIVYLNEGDFISINLLVWDLFYEACRKCAKKQPMIDQK